MTSNLPAQAGRDALAGLDRDADDEDQQLSRVTVVVGERLIDLGLPTGVGASVLANEILEIVRAQDPGGVAADAATGDEADAGWTLARLGGSVIDPQRSLGEAGVFDGDVLLIQSVDGPKHTVLVDDLGPSDGADVAARPSAGSRARRGRLGWFALGALLTGALVALLPGLSIAPAPFGVPVVPVVVLVLGIATVTVAVVARYSRTLDDSRSTAIGVAAVGLLLVFGGTLFAIPDVSGLAALPMALGAAVLVAVVLLLTGVGRAFFTAVISIGALGVPAALVWVIAEPSAPSLGAVLATIAVLAVYLAPGVTIMASRLPVPRVPTAGEPLDDIEIQGGTAVDGTNALGAISRVVPTEAGMTQRVTRAADHLTGIVVAAALTAIVGCALAVDVGDGIGEFRWQGIVFGFAVATVLCLRGRSHHDLAQAATLIGAGLVVAWTVVVEVAIELPAWRVVAALALVALALLSVLCGVVAPRVEFSPVLRRWAEIGEYLAIAFVVPLACWIVGLYAFFRELRL